MTYYCDNLNPQSYYAPLRPADSLLNLGLASVGIWVGIIFLLAGIFGISSGLRRRKPAFGTKPARDSYSKLIYSCFVLTVLSAVLSAVLVAISAALSGEWLLYLFDVRGMSKYSFLKAGTVHELKKFVRHVKQTFAFPVSQTAIQT